MRLWQGQDSPAWGSARPHCLNKWEGSVLRELGLAEGIQIIPHERSLGQGRDQPLPTEEASGLAVLLLRHIRP